jgi:2-haloacid dehalogenase
LDEGRVTARTPIVALLDVNETLSDLEPLRERFEDVGAPRELLETWFASTLRDGFALTASGQYAGFLDVGRAGLRTLLTPAQRLRLPLEEAAEHILSGFAELPVHPDVAPALRGLHDAGVRVATLTNGSAASAERLLERAGLSDVVERNLDVAAVGRWKPHPHPYRHATRELGVIPSDAVLIAAHPWDVNGAKQTGLRGAWVDRHGAPYPDVFARPDATAGDLPSLVAELLD